MSGLANPQPEERGLTREFFRPDSALWWLFCFALAIGSAGVLLEFAKPFLATREALWPIAPVFAVSLALFAGIVLWTDIYRARRGWVLLLATIFGATVPTWLSLHANGFLTRLSLEWLPPGVGGDWGAAVAGPTSEEWSKMLGVVLIMLIAGRTLRRPVHGLLVGAFVGLGFQIFENVSYAANGAGSDANSDLSGALNITLLRSSVGFSSHWLYTAIVGVGVAYLLGRTLRGMTLLHRIAAFLGLYGVGWGLHFLWNSPVPPGPLGLLALPLKILLALLCFALVTRLAWKEERDHLAQALALVCPSTSSPVLRRGCEDEAVRGAIGTLRERRAGLRAARKAGGTQAVRALKRERAAFLDALQGLGATGSRERVLSTRETAAVHSTA